VHSVPKKAGRAIPNKTKRLCSKTLSLPVIPRRLTVLITQHINNMLTTSPSRTQTSMPVDHDPVPSTAYVMVAPVMLTPVEFAGVPINNITPTINSQTHISTHMENLEKSLMIAKAKEWQTVKSDFVDFGDQVKQTKSAPHHNLCVIKGLKHHRASRFKPYGGWQRPSLSCQAVLLNKTSRRVWSWTVKEEQQWQQLSEASNAPATNSLELVQVRKARKALNKLKDHKFNYDQVNMIIGINYILLI